MTLPNERTRSVVQTREFLVSLLDPKKTPRVPSQVRKQAARLLRHYPSGLDMEEAGRFGRVFCSHYRCDT